MVSICLCLNVLSSPPSGSVHGMCSQPPLPTGMYFRHCMDAAKNLAKINLGLVLWKLPPKHGQLTRGKCAFNKTFTKPLAPLFCSKNFLKITTMIRHYQNKVALAYFLYTFTKIIPLSNNTYLVFIDLAKFQIFPAGLCIYPDLIYT